MLSRRAFLNATAAATILAPALGRRAAAETIELTPGLPEGLGGTAPLEALPGKKPLVKLTYRPPNYETPLYYFGETITPNDAFFVRYHLAGIPESIDPKAWRLKVSGAVERPLDLGLDDLRAMPSTEVVAVCQCSGNRRGLFQPHVPGVEWGYGAMGNARWKGVRLKDVMEKAGLKSEAIEIVCDGEDGPVLDETPDFVKSIPSWKAADESVLLAYEMNGEPLPLLNGFPVRLIVPGWTGTYWMKHLVSLEAVTKPFDGFWMKSAYRVPAGKFAFAQHFATQETAVNTPITEMMVNSLITAPKPNARTKAGEEVEVKGLAWDGGYGILGVDISIDGGNTSSAADLGEDLGRFSFRSWSYRFKPSGAGRLTIMASARNKAGQTQTAELIANPAGYHHNLISQVTIDVA